MCVNVNLLVLILFKLEHFSDVAIQIYDFTLRLRLLKMLL